MQRNMQHATVDFNIICQDPDQSTIGRDSNKNDPIFNYKTDRGINMYTRDIERFSHPHYRMYLYSNMDNVDSNILAMFPNGIVIPITYNPNLFANGTNEIYALFKAKYPDVDFSRTKGIFVIEYFDIMNAKLPTVSTQEELKHYYSNESSSIYKHYGFREISNYLIETYGDRTTLKKHEIIRSVSFIPYSEIQDNETTYYRQLNLVLTTRDLDYLVHENSPYRVQIEHELDDSLDLIVNIIDNTREYGEYYMFSLDKKIKSLFSKRDTRKESGLYFTYLSKGKVIANEGPIPLSEMYKYGIVNDRAKLNSTLRSVDELEVERLHAQNKKLELEIESSNSRYLQEKELAELKYRNELEKLQNELQKVMNEKEALQLKIESERRKHEYEVEELERKSELSVLDMDHYARKKEIDMTALEHKNRLDLRISVAKFRIDAAASANKHMREMELLDRQIARSSIDTVGKAIGFCTSLFK